ncbi:pyruvate carboxylase 2 [[Candida] jaroonii]|uniref:Pyruvate carboxylase 2 n=1 Tax=[Candida] jaroonii TaxID=467808 RepID=A0ACA9Y3B6_9ASCO|nr:pyruvate carboxylase 2 [[Candida] jaroonii]
MAEFKQLKRVLIANRGEIACRLIKACKENNIYTISIFTKDDSNSLHINNADESHLISSYINTEEIIEIAVKFKAQAVIPGYGFVSENHLFAQELKNHNISFIGPSPENIQEFGLKHIARQLAIDAEVPTVPGSGLIEKVEEGIEEAEKIGFPVLLKASSGGGGMGMKVCYSKEEIEAGLKEVKSRGANLFKNDATFLEKYVESGRHIEIQVFGNGKGDVITLGERECSIQRRHQKVVEEAPSPFVTKTLPSLRNKLAACAKRLASSVKYKSAGTIEFLVDDKTGDAYFLEMNTRLQVEHGITELCYDADLVMLMLLQCDYELRGEQGIPVEMMNDLVKAKRDDEGFTQPNGHSIEVRIYAENPINNFVPSPGVLQYVEFPQAKSEYKVRFDHWIKTGTEITPFFDPLLGKLMIWAPTRQEAITGMLELLTEIKLYGPPNNVEYLYEILNSEMFKTGNTLTSTLDTFQFKPSLLEFHSGGALTTVQDFPGRLVYNGGIPRSGPVDDLSFRIGNALVGNEDLGTEGLEIILSGPSLYFHKPATIALCGAEFEFSINDEPSPMWSSISIPADTTVEIGSVISSKSDKCYLLVKGGLPNIAKYLGSKSTSPSINIGGYQGRKFLPGDCIQLPNHQPIDVLKVNYTLPKEYLPNFDNDWTIRCLNGPHSSSEILSEEGRDILYNSEYKINPATSRGSVALDGPRCKFSRKDGGDGGNHPSNITEYIYPNRGLSVIADNTVVASADGITLSGFICPIVPIDYDWWKLGQAKAGSKIKFQNITFKDAMKFRKERSSYLEFIKTLPKAEAEGKYVDEFDFEKVCEEDVILYSREDKPGQPSINIRQAGESCIIVDHGISKFSLPNCGRLFKLKLDIGNAGLKGINRMETANALSIFFDADVLDRDELVQTIMKIDASISFEKKLEIPSRKFKIPVCLTHPLIKETIERYMKTQRPYAAYLPDNLDYIMKSSCIDTLEEFKERAFNNPQIIVAVSFLCASNILVHADPRKSFLSGKYNPPRITGPAGSITTGSVVQGMRAVDGPGGYMLWGVGLRHAYWDTFAMRENFQEKGLPWFLEPFDQVEFYEVDEKELDEFNELNKIGKLALEPEHLTFDVAEYHKFFESVVDEVEVMREKQRASAAKLLEYDNELKKKWEAEVAEEKKKNGGNSSTTKVAAVEGKQIKSSMTASVFKVNVKVGDVVKGGDTVIVLEAMKTEIPVHIPGSKTKEYKVIQILTEEKALVSPDETLLVLSI